MAGHSEEEPIKPLLLWVDHLLEKPDLSEDKIVACLRESYDIHAVQVTFLPLGADENTAVFRLITSDAIPYFLKLRAGAFEELSLLLPHFLHEQGIQHMVPPLATITGQFWAHLEQFTTILYPFVEGHNGYERPLTEEHWRTLGTAVHRFQTITLPTNLINLIRQETFSSQWRDMVQKALVDWVTVVYDDPVARDCATFLQDKREQINHLIARTAQLGQSLQAKRLPFTLCHTDLHAGNVLLTDHALYIVDWDAPLLAPKERDLMFAGAGLFGNGRDPAQEEALFYQGYGPVDIDHMALAYYRFERIIEDIAVYCRQLLLTNEGGEDRAQSFYYLQSNFLPGSTIDIAHHAFVSHL